MNTSEHWNMALEGRPILGRLPLRLKKCVRVFSCLQLREAQLRYDFNRKPGSRLIAQQMVDDLIRKAIGLARRSRAAMAVYGDAP